MTEIEILLLNTNTHPSQINMKYPQCSFWQMFHLIRLFPYHHTSHIPYTDGQNVLIVFQTNRTESKMSRKQNLTRTIPQQNPRNGNKFVNKYTSNISIIFRMPQTNEPCQREQNCNNKKLVSYSTMEINKQI